MSRDILHVSAPTVCLFGIIVAPMAARKQGTERAWHGMLRPISRGRSRRNRSAEWRQEDAYWPAAHQLHEVSLAHVQQQLAQIVAAEAPAVVERRTSRVMFEVCRVEAVASSIPATVRPASRIQLVRERVREEKDRIAKCLISLVGLPGLEPGTRPL